MIVQPVIDQLDAAISYFGTYQLHDKGAAEVMDVEAAENLLQDAGVEATVNTLIALKAHPHGQPLIDELITVFVENEEWPELTDALLAGPHKNTFVGWLS